MKKMKTLSESILAELNRSTKLESFSYNINDMVKAVTDYYTEKTGSNIVNSSKAHTSSGGLSESDYVRVIFNDGTIMVFYKGGMHSNLKIYKDGDDSYYQFELYESSYKETLDRYINGDEPTEGLHSFDKGKPPYSDVFALQDVIDNKGDIVIELDKSGNNKDEIIKMFNKLPDDFPVIITSGLWNSIRNGTLKTKEQLGNINFNNIYGGKDEFIIYDNLVYLKFVGGNELY